MRAKVKAFTIIEITISMLIAALVIGIAYTAYTIVNKSYLSYNNKHEEMAVLLRINELMTKDFDHADIIEKSDSGLTIIRGSNMINYVFTPDYIVHTAGIVDTFKVKTQEISTLFENQPITNTGMDEEQNRVDELNITIVYQNKMFPYHFFKHYSSADLFQRKNNAIN